MSFGGVSGMITSLKNNDRRHKRAAFDGRISSDTTSQGIKITPISEAQLQQIREKLKKQRHALFKKRVLVSCFIIVLLTVALLYFSNYVS